MNCLDMNEDVLDEVFFGRVYDEAIHTHLAECSRCSAKFTEHKVMIAKIRAAMAELSRNYPGEE